MKQLLILSFLLLSFPLFGQSKGTDVLYIWENGTRYIGEWKDGKGHGQRSLINRIQVCRGIQEWEKTW